MNVLIISQYLNQNYFEMFQKIFPIGTKFIIHAGNNIKEEKNIEIIRAPKHDARSLFSRLKCWFLFLIHIKKWIRNNKNCKIDLIFATSNPPINAYIGNNILKKKFNAPFIYMNWDIYPQIIEETYDNFFVKIFCKIWHRMNNYIYPQIDKIITIGDIISDSIRKCLDKPIDIEVIPLSTDLERIKPISKDENIFIREQRLQGYFIVLYSGKMGYGHNIKLILEASNRLKSYSDIKFVLIGYGPGYDLVKHYIDRNDTNNVLLYPLQPDSMFPYSISCGDIGIVSQENNLAHLFMPSKVYDMMAAGIGIIGITSGEDDLSNLIRNKQIGLCVCNNSSQDLANIILDLYQNREKAKLYGTRARITMENDYNEDIIIEKYKKLLQEVLKDR